MAAYVVVNTTNSDPNYTTSRDVTRDPVRAHASGVLELDVHQRMCDRRRTDAGNDASLDRRAVHRRSAGGREQVRAGRLGGVELRAADPEDLRADLGEPAISGYRVGEPLYTV
jgi:hypothetical protein